MNKKIIIFISVVFIFFNPLTVRAQDSQRYGKTDVTFEIKTGYLDLVLQTYELFQNQLFQVEVTLKTNQSVSANIFNVTLELPINFTIINDINYHSNPPINETTDYKWITSWIVNSSIALPTTYKINATENLFFNKKSEDITINSGPMIPYNFTVITDKPSYSFGETGTVFVYIADKNGYPFNIDGKCNSTIYYPNKTSTSFKNVLMSYVFGSKGEYISSSSFQVWRVEGTYTVELNCTKPDGYGNNTFTVSTGITTTISVTAEPTQPSGPGQGPSPGPSPVPAQPSAKVVNFSTNMDLIKISLTPNKAEKRSIKVFNNGKSKLDLTGKILYIDQFTSFKEGGIEYKFELNPDETKEIEINFFVKKDQEAGVYPGRVVFTAEGIERTVLIIIEIESEKPLFDVKVETLSNYRMVYPGNKVMAQLTIYNLGKVGKVDVNIEYGIKDLSGNVIINANEILAVETQVSLVKSLNLPSTMKADSYIFYSKVSYNNIIGTGSDMFLVIEKMGFRLDIIYWLLIIIIILILALVLFYKLRKKKKINEKPKTKKKRR
jgi:hypothetical protein